VIFSRRHSLKTLAAAVAAPTFARAASNGTEQAAKPIRLVVLDVGGTLIEDHGEVPNAMHDALTKKGVEVSFAEIGEWRGASKRGMVRHFVELRTKPDAKRESLIAAIYEDFSKQVNAAYADVRPIAGAEDCVRALRGMGLLVATSTGFDRPLTDKIFAHLKWRDYFVATVTSDDVVDGRPSPFMLFHAMEARPASMRVCAVWSASIRARRRKSGCARNAIRTFFPASRNFPICCARNSDAVGCKPVIPDGRTSAADPGPTAKAAPWFPALPRISSGVGRDDTLSLHEALALNSEHVAQDEIQNARNGHGAGKRQHPRHRDRTHRAPLQTGTVRRHRTRDAAGEDVRCGYR
jgi:phosphoglycolate phosphatase-like HAD superfamily hydrolase